MLEFTEQEIDHTENDDAENDNICYEISNFPSDLSLIEYHRKWKNGDIEIPDFQRNYVWNKRDASRLVESFLLGLPVPGVFLYKRRRDNKLLIIDGQQRITSVVRYIEGSFDDRIFRLSGVKKAWENKAYTDLNDTERRCFENAILRATIIQQLNPDDESSIFHIFERLNTGGKNLNPMEVRRCIYRSKLLTHIETLNQHIAWRSLIGKKQIDLRYQDVEWILRAIALAVNFDSYEKPMKIFLNNFCIKYKADYSKELEIVLNRFYALTDYLLKNLGERPFNLKGKINYAVIDSVIGSLITIDDIAWPNDLKSRYERLKNDDEFIKNISANTSDINVIQKRFERVRNILLG